MSTYVLVTSAWGVARVYPLDVYTALPSAALLGTRAQLITRAEAIAIRAQVRR